MSRSVPVRAPAELETEAPGAPGGVSRRFDWRWTAVAGDVIAVGGAFLLAYWLRYVLRLGPDLTPFQVTSIGAYWPVGVGFGAVMLLELYLHGVYRRRRRLLWLDEMPKVFNSALIATAAVIVIFFLFRPAFFSRLMFGYLFVLGLAGVGSWRAGLRLFIDWRHRRGIDLENVLIVGSGNVAKMLMQQMRATPGLGYQLVGFLDDDRENGRDFGRFRRLGSIQQLEEIAAQQRLDLVIVALPTSTPAAGGEAVAACRRIGVAFTVVPDLVELQAGRIDMEEIAGIPLITLTSAGIQGLRFAQKRLLDISLALLTLLVLSPLLLVVTAAIKLDSRGRVLFRQQRIGKNGKPFTLMKFRSMVAGAEQMRTELYPDTESEMLFKRRDDSRRTRVGQLLRRTSMDELPQLINVLRGDMSLVGPRAQVPEEVALYDEWAHNRLTVLPGMTGLWQVSGRSNLSFEEMVMLDTYYVGHWSLGLDLKILLRTIPAVLRGDGAF